MNQRLFAIELRTQIDRAMAGDRQAARRAIGLARSHPTHLQSKHVQHNLKAWRLTWLERARAHEPLSGHPEPLV